MANLKSSKKAILVTKRNKLRNANYKSRMKSFLKKAIQAIEKKEDTVLDTIKLALQIIDKTTPKGIIKKKTAARKKSRLMKLFNKKANQVPETKSTEKTTKKIKVVAAKKKSNK